jgi:glycine/D-amino acid oxidase-like deaminating enzyme
MTMRLQRQSITIIGGGATGVLLAAHLLSDPDEDVRVTLIERDGRMSPEAYAKAFEKRLRSLEERLGRELPRDQLAATWVVGTPDQAADRLTDRLGEVLRDRHAALYERVAAEAGPALWDHRLVETLARLDAENADLRAAVARMQRVERRGPRGAVEDELARLRRGGEVALARRPAGLPGPLDRRLVAG